MKRKIRKHRDIIANTITGCALLFFALTIIFTSSRNNDNIQAVGNHTTALETTSHSIGKKTEVTTSDKTSTNANNTDETTPVKNKNWKKLIDFKAKYPFFIRINRAQNFATVYGRDFDGNYTVAYKTFICSTGIIEDYTPLGRFEIEDKYRWHLMVDGTYAQYAIRIYGQIMLHSLPYEHPSSDSLEYKEYNKLGKAASLGCARFRVSDIKWIYEHCPVGTEVEIYEGTNEIPEIPLPKIKKLKKTDDRKNWDPTDPKKNNPWNKKEK